MAQMQSSQYGGDVDLDFLVRQGVYFSPSSFRGFRSLDLFTLRARWGYAIGVESGGVSSVLLYLPKLSLHAVLKEAK